jgi:hypothetical protein
MKSVNFLYIIHSQCFILQTPGAYPIISFGENLQVFCKVDHFKAAEKNCCFYKTS